MAPGRSLDLGKLIVVNLQQNDSRRLYDHCSRLALVHLVHGRAGLLDRHGILFDYREYSRKHPRWARLSAVVVEAVEI